ncbi:hypothetical protein [Gemmata palustris]|uniref:hypothetical protein n=1 Tax=Gemmata palustris TaxID=2822762 RepID=UPI0028F3E892|nr:hypothetical protein [Gemmata palustris]
MTEAEWLTYPDPKQILEWLRDGVTCRKLRLFATGSVRQFWDLLIDERSREAVRVAEEVADGRESEDALDAAYRRAWDAVPQLPSDRYAHVSAARAAGRTVQNDNDAWYASDLTVNETFGVYCDLREEEGSSDDERAYLQWVGEAETKRLLSGLLRDIFGNPFRPVAFSPSWRTSTVLALASQMYESRDFGAMPILADALQDAGCDSADMLDHCRGPGPHVRGCWVVDVVLGKE